MYNFVSNVVLGNLYQINIFHYLLLHVAAIVITFCHIRFPNVNRALDGHCLVRGGGVQNQHGILKFTLKQFNLR